MSRILFAWELGGGYGHLGPFRPMAEALIQRGHDITIAAREVERAQTVFGALALRIVQAPLCVKTYSGLQEPPLNYAEILMRYGYLDAPQLRGLMHAWRGLLDLTRAEVLVADHAPTAFLAARGRDIGRVAIGTPFSVPPAASPTPNMRPWVGIPEQRLASSDAVVLETINAALAPGEQRLGAVHGIFDDVSRLFTGVPELDPYGPRDALSFLGLSGGRFGTGQPRWPEGDGPRIFAYLSGEYKHIDATLAALAASPARCLVRMDGLKPAFIEKYQTPLLQFAEEMLELDSTVAASDICVCHGNFGTVMSMLRGGKPMLLLPIQLEHFLLSAGVERLGIAGLVHPDAPAPDIPGTLARVMRETALLDAARAFALEHAEPSVGTITQRAASHIEEMAKTRGRPT